MKQEVTRMHKTSARGQEAWSLDDVVISTSLSGNRDPTEGVFVHGLYLEGFKWGRSGLEDSDPKVMFVTLPTLYITALN